MLLIITPTEAFPLVPLNSAFSPTAFRSECIFDLFRCNIPLCTNFCPGMSALKIRTLSHFKLLWQAVRLFAFPLPWIKHFSLISTLELKTY